MHGGTDMLYNCRMAPKQSIFMRVLLMPEGDFWVAQALEHDIAAQGRSEDGARQAFLKTLSAQAQLDIENGREPLQDIPPAPDWYFEAYQEARESDSFLKEPSLPEAYIAQAVSDQHASE
jgi:hypothetical protein